MLLVLFVVSLITFLLMHAVPGGPFDREKAVPPEILANLNAKYHLDEPLPKQYLRYLWDVFIPHISRIPPGTSLTDDHLINIKIGEKLWLKWMNFGPSYSSRSRTVNDYFRQQFPISAQLGTLALLVAVLIGIPLGILAALKQNTIWDYLGMGIAIFGVSVPCHCPWANPDLDIWSDPQMASPNGLGGKASFYLGFYPLKTRAGVL
jgi:ABC-type dipeptide/oligopeptide/nickel transport system permease component